MRIPLHDHENKKQPMYCTLMKEICHGGWTKSMGEVPTPDGATVRPRCHEWVGVYVNDPREGKTKEVFDCRRQWETDLMQQVAQEVYQGAVATEQVRNNVVENTQAAKTIQSFFLQLAQKMGHRLQSLPPAADAALTHDNNKGANGHEK